MFHEIAEDILYFMVHHLQRVCKPNMLLRHTDINEKIVNILMGSTIFFKNNILYFHLSKYFFCGIYLLFYILVEYWENLLKKRFKRKTYTFSLKKLTLQKYPLNYFK